MAVDLGALLEEDEVQTETPSRHSHIIDRGDSTMNAETLILTARVMGTPVTALCGHTWVPDRDPAKYPVCPKCMEMYEFAKSFRGV